jgi:hypothetical protein
MPTLVDFVEANVKVIADLLNRHHFNTERVSDLLMLNERRKSADHFIHTLTKSNAFVSAGKQQRCPIS